VLVCQLPPLSQSAICGGTIGGNPSVCESEITFVVESVMCRFPCVCSRVLFYFLIIRSHFVCILREKSPPIYCAWFGVMGLRLSSFVFLGCTRPEGLSNALSLNFVL
jgi:hypothetical protein